MKGGYYFFVGMIFLLTSCKETTTNTTEVHNNLNAPVTANVTNSFTYTINAKQFSGNSNNELSFHSDSLVVALTSTLYSAGQAIVVVTDSANEIVFSDTIKSNKVIAIAHLKSTTPKHCNLEITKLTGQFTFALVGQ